MEVGIKIKNIFSRKGLHIEKFFAKMDVERRQRMIGILVASHGEMAQGMVNSAEIFFGENIQGLKALCLKSGDDPEKFSDRIEAALKEVDEGDGVVIFCDLMGGTPGNRSAMLLREEEMRNKVKVITGMNFPMLLEFLGKRLALENIEEFDAQELVETGQNGIKCLNDLFK